MEQVKRKGKMIRRTNKPLAERVEKRITEPLEEEQKDLQELQVPLLNGPLGNTDFVPFGSDAHKALLGLDPETDELTFDTASLPEKVVDKFKAQRVKWLNAKPRVPASIPPMFNPDKDDRDVTRYA